MLYILLFGLILCVYLVNGTGICAIQVYNDHWLPVSREDTGEYCRITI